MKLFGKILRYITAILLALIGGVFVLVIFIVYSDSIGRGVFNFPVYLFYLFAAYLLFRNRRNYYIHLIVGFVICYVYTTLFRLIFVTGWSLELTDATNLLFYSTPGVLVVIVYFIENKASSSQQPQQKQESQANISSASSKQM